MRLIVDGTVFSRIAVNLHDPRVRIDGEQRAQLRQMTRRLQHPPIGARSP